jgi:hypothetical protein
VSLWLLAVLAAAPRVELWVDPCVEPPGVLDRLLSLELGAPVLAAVEPPSADATRVRLECDGALVRVEVIDPTTGKTAHRRIDPAAASGATRPRLLALATAELVSASWLELAARPAPVAAVDATASPAARAAATELLQARLEPAKDKPWLVSLHASGFGFVGPEQSLGFGGRLGLERSIAWRLALRTELAVDHASARDPLGSLDLLSGSLSLLAMVRLPSPVPLSLGLGARGGVARLLGQPDQSRATDGFSRTGPWTSAVANVRLRVADADRGGLSISFEGGVVIWPFTGLRSDGRAFGVDGGFVALQLGWELPW